MPPETETNALAVTADIIVAYLANNKLAPNDLPGLISSVYSAIILPKEPPKEEPAPRPDPAVPIRSSVKPDYIVCLEDGKRATLLRPYIMNKFGLTPQAYRERWGLPEDYPMTAPSYVERRRKLAMDIGLGRRKPEPPPPAKPTPKAKSAPKTPAVSSKAAKPPATPAKQPTVESQPKPRETFQPDITSADLEDFANSQGGEPARRTYKKRAAVA